MDKAAPPAAAPSLPLALLGGAATLLAPHLGALAFAWRAGDARDAWHAGGSAMTAVVVVSALAVLASAVLVLLAGRQWAWAAAPLPVLVALPAGWGAVLGRSDLGGALRAVAEAAPSDRAIILAASVSDSLWPATLGALLSAGLALALAAGLGCAALARRANPEATARLALALGALAALALAAVAATSALAVRRLGDAYRLLAEPAEPLGRSLAEVLTSAQAWHRGVGGAAVVLGLVVLIGAALLRRAPRPALLFVVANLAGLGALVAAARPRVRADVVDAISASARGPALFAFDAPRVRVRTSGGLAVGNQPAADVAAAFTEKVESWKGLHRAASDQDPPALALALSPDVTTDALTAALAALARADVGPVVLLTTPRAVPAPPPSPLPAPFEAASQEASGVELTLGREGILCAEPCPVAQLSDDALELDGERWALEPGGDVASLAAPRPLWLTLEPRAPRLLLRAALTATKHGRRLTLLVPGDAAGAARWSVEAALGALTTVGGLEAPLARAEVADQLESVTGCFVELEAPPRLPVTVQLQLGVDSSGAVSTAEVDGPSDDAIAGCLRDGLKRWTFSRPGAHGLSIVSARVTFRFRN